MANVSIRNVFTNNVITFDNDSGYAYTHDGVSGFLVVKEINGADVVLMVFDDAVDQIGDSRIIQAPIDMNHVFSTNLTVEDTEDYFDENDEFPPPPQNFRVYYADWNSPFDNTTLLKVALYLIDGDYHVMRELWENNVAIEIVPSGYDLLTANGIENVQVDSNNYNIVSPVTGTGGLNQPPNFPVQSFLALMPNYSYQDGVFYTELPPPSQQTGMPIGAIRWDAWYPRYYTGETEQHVQLPWLPSYVNAGNMPWGQVSQGITTYRDAAWTIGGGMTMVNPEYRQYQPFHTVDDTPQNLRFPYFSPSAGTFVFDGNDRTNSLRYRGTEQSVMDAELQYAVDMGLDYWMFLFYGDDSPLCYGRRLYEATANKRGIKMAYCTHQMGGNPLGAIGTADRGVYDNSIETITNAMVQSYYQTTQSGRPIVFLDFQGDDRIQHMAQIKSDITFKYQQKGGQQQIYWVLLVISTADPYHYSFVNSLGLDSITWYSQYGDNQDRNYVTSIHNRTMNRLDELWNTSSRGGKGVTPCFTMSFFNKPMYTHSPSDRVRLDLDYIYTNVATPTEAANGLQQVVNWANQRSCETMIVYSWNEHYEAGICLCPRKLPNGNIDLSYVNAIAGVLNP